MKSHIHVVFSHHQTVDRTFSSNVKRITAGVWIDLDRLNEVVIQAARNKSRKSTSGAICVEVHSIEPLGEQPLVACR